MKNSELTIDKIQAGDVDAVFSLACQTRHSNWSKKDYEQEISRTDNIVLAARKSETIIGFIISRLIIAKAYHSSNSNPTNNKIILEKPTAEIQIQLDEPDEIENQSCPVPICDCEIEIFNIAVAREFRNKGIGGALIEKLLVESRRMTVDCKITVWLEVRESNWQAISFYTANKFKQCFERKNYYAQPTENALVLKREV